MIVKREPCVLCAIGYNNVVSFPVVPLPLTATSDRYCNRPTYNNGQFIKFLKLHVLATPFIFLHKNCCNTYSCTFSPFRHLIANMPI